MTDKARTVLIEPPGARTGERGIAVLLAAQGRAVTRDIAPDQDAGAIGREPEPGHVGLEGAGLQRSRASCGQVEHPQLVRTRFGREEIEPLAVRAEGGAGFAGIGQIDDPFGRAARCGDAPQPRSALVAGEIGIGLLPYHPLAVGRRRWLGHALQQDKILPGHRMRASRRWRRLAERWGGRQGESEGAKRKCGVGHPHTGSGLSGG